VTLELEDRLIAAVRWNALTMVVRANKPSAELGATSQARLPRAEPFDLGFNHFFKAAGHEGRADLSNVLPPDEALRRSSGSAGAPGS
jgi:pyruvate dehydrogenase E1 component